ncbi:MAG: hypothetical protein P9M13_10380 [Candidatus Ancaeobacter aquaticus]|nr:hypothetical protein [Candidatus Ancaeobacter aquaticus]
MAIIILILIAVLILYILYKIYMRTVEWILEPLSEYMQDKDAERFAVNEREDEDDEEQVELPRALRNKKDQLIHTICNCPKCKKKTAYYDPKIKRTRCTSCEWVDMIDSEMTLEQYYNCYHSLIDKSELVEKAEVVLDGLDKPVYLPKSLLEKAKKKPQKLPNSNLWIYKDYIFSCRPTGEKIKEIFGCEN